MLTTITSQPVAPRARARGENNAEEDPNRRVVAPRPRAGKIRRSR